MLMSGGTGFLMSRLAKQFLEEGHEIFFLVRPTNDTSPEERMRQQLGDFKCNQWHVIVGDTTQSLWGIEKNDLDKLKGEVTEVWHGAALVRFDSSKKYLANSTNIEGTRHALEVAEYLQAPLHYISTAYIAREDSRHRAYETQECRMNPRNIYEETKCNAELLIHQWQEAGKGTAVIYRPAILIGDSRTGEAQGFTGYYMVARFFVELKTRRLVLFIPYVWGARLNLIPVNWAVDLITQISAHSEAHGKIFHITNPHPPLLRFLFHHAITYFHLNGVFLLPMPVTLLRASALFFDHLFALIPLRSFRHMRKQFLFYLPYFAGDPSFLQRNVKKILKNNIPPITITKEILDRCLDYAIAHNFGINQ